MLKIKCTYHIKQLPSKTHPIQHNSQFLKFCILNYIIKRQMDKCQMGKWVDLVNPFNETG